MNRGLKKIRTTLAQNDFVRLTVGLFWGIGVAEITEIADQLTPRSHDHWQKFFCTGKRRGRVRLSLARFKLRSLNDSHANASP